MELKKTLERINKDREKIECCFVFSCWEEPGLYEDYKHVNEGNDKTLRDSDAIFYWELGRAMHEQGVRHFDAISVDSFLSNNEDTREKFERFGGYQTVRELSELIDPENVVAYYDEINKRNSLGYVAKKFDELFTDKFDKLENATNDEVYAAFETLNNSIALSSGHGVEIEDLTVTEEFVKRCKEKEASGIYYGNSLPLLNYITLGLPLGDVTLVSAASGQGKSSFVFENFAVALAENETPVVIFSNEMRADAYRHLLLVHILTHDLNYYGLTRKKIKLGDYTAEEEALIEQAIDISETKYNHIKFIKLFDNNTNLLMKYLKKFARQGYQCFIWDTFKNDDLSDGKEEWLQLLKNSRRVFNLVSALNVSMVMTFQQALYTTNQRFLDASCLAGSKQVKEVVSELIMIRNLWSDEFNNEKADCKPYTWDKEHKKKESITLDPDKKYMVVFINKSRNDEASNQLLIQWDAQWNKFKEVGFCNIRNDHRGG